jgi:RNA polymerase sigma-70 factor (ECF subfamily)
MVSDNSGEHQNRMEKHASQALMNMNTLRSACTGSLQMAGSTLLDVILHVKETETNTIPSSRGAVFIMTDFNEQTALEGLRKLDSQSVGTVYDRYFPEVYRYVRYRVGDENIAEDIASDVFVRLLEACRKKQSPQSNLRGWLIATASNAVNDHHRRNYRRPMDALSETMPDASPSIHSEVDSREKQRLVQGALAQLTLEQQHVIALRFGQGYSLEETAAFLNKNINAVKALQFRALASLQRQIGEVNYE